MCNHDTLATKRAASLSDGHAHDQDHNVWTRRQFVTGLGLAAVGSAISISGTPIRALAGTPLLQRLKSVEGDRVVVMIQLSGGNDGLNTIVPVTNDLYYNSRPDIAISADQTIALSGDLGMHPAMAPLESIYGDGNMAVVNGVGYPSPVLSHFQSTDIWVTGQELSSQGNAGWSGRSLEKLYPDFEEESPEFPIAMQIGGNSPLLFQGLNTQMGMSLLNIELFEQIANTGKVFNEDDVPNNPLGSEISFVRSIANDSYLYASAIQDAASVGSNAVEYPDTTLGENLSIIAKLIKGDLGTRIYHVNLGGFDTHSNQLTRHTTLLDNLSRSIEAFLSDMNVGGKDEDVLVMTFSEFGRRINQNGSGGSDHGTAAPLFLFGKGVDGGLYGELPSLAEVDRVGNLIFSTDFRSIYASVLNKWFGIPEDEVTDVFGAEYDLIPLFDNPSTVSTDQPSIPLSFDLSQNYPNPFNPTTRISFSLGRPGLTQLDVFDISGRKVRSVVNSVLPAGQHEFDFRADGLASGTYLYRLKTPSATLSRQMTLLR